MRTLQTYNGYFRGNDRSNINSDCIGINITEIWTRQCRFPMIYLGRETALPCPRLSFRLRRI